MNNINSFFPFTWADSGAFDYNVNLNLVFFLLKNQPVYKRPETAAWNSLHSSTVELTNSIKFDILYFLHSCTLPWKDGFFVLAKMWGYIHFEIIFTIIWLNWTHEISGFYQIQTRQAY